MYNADTEDDKDVGNTEELEVNEEEETVGSEEALVVELEANALTVTEPVGLAVIVTAGGALTTTLDSDTLPVLSILPGAKFEEALPPRVTLELPMTEAVLSSDTGGLS